MLGLGNAINKARVYKTFVGPAATYEYISEGSVGESGYIIGHAIYDADDILVDPDNIVVGGEYYIKYTEVYPEAVLIYPTSNPVNLSDKPNSKTTAQEWGYEIHNNLSFVGDLDNDGVLTSSDDWRMISPTEFDFWKSYIYNSPEFEGVYFEGNSENPYISVLPGYYNTWLGLGFTTPPETAVNSFVIDHTDGSGFYYPEYNDLINTSYYTLAVRTFQPEDQLQFFGQTPQPTSPPLPTEPQPVPYVQRNSTDLSADVTVSPGGSSIDFTANSSFLLENNINIYLVDRPPSLSYSDYLKIQFNVEFPVNQSTNVVDPLDPPWDPDNTEQKKLYVDYVILGWKDFPFIDLPLTTDGLLEAISSGVSPSELYEYSEKLLTAEVNLNKVTLFDINNNDTAPGSTLTPPLDDGYYAKNISTDPQVFYGYTGYLDIGNASAGNLDSSYSSITLKDFAQSQQGLVDSDNRYFIVRILGIRFGTDERIPSAREAFPQNMQYILMPILNNNQFSAFYNYSPNGLADDFISFVFSGSSGQSLPPAIDGQNEDYYN